MEFEKLTRDAERVHATLRDMEDGSIVTRTGCKILIPSRYVSSHLADIADEIRIAGVFAIIVDDQYYGVSMACAMMQILPSSQNFVEVDEDEYILFTFDKGSMITPNRHLLKDGMIVYFLMEEIYIKGYKPYFLSYEDMGDLFTSSVYHAGLRLAPNNVPLEMIVASNAREPDDRTRYYRHRDDPVKDQYKEPPAFIGLRNTSLAVVGTLAKMTGSHLKDGLTSALTRPNTKVENLERLLRK